MGSAWENNSFEQAIVVRSKVSAAFEQQGFCEEGSQQQWVHRDDMMTPLTMQQNSSKSARWRDVLAFRSVGGRLWWSVSTSKITSTNILNVTKPSSVRCGRWSAIKDSMLLSILELTCCCRKRLAIENKRMVWRRTP